MLLCFGDSNAWGFQPGGGRYRHDQSWPALLAARLETTLDLQAQPGRTLQAQRPQAGLLAAPQAWQQALQRAPQRIVLALGINDLAAGASLQAIDAALHWYLQQWQQLSPTASLILLAPRPLGALTAGWRQLFQGQEANSQQLAALWQQQARQWGCGYYLPPPQVVGDDGLHWLASGHQSVAADLHAQFLSL